MSNNRLIAALISLLAIAALSAIVAACVSPAPRSTAAQQNLNAAQVQATNAALLDQAEEQAAQSAQNRAADQARRATDQAIAATEQARNDAAAQLTLEQQQIAATATRQALDRQMKLDTQSATKSAVEMQATVVSANAALSLIEQNKSRESDLWYILPDYLMRYAPCGALLLLFFLLWYLARAVAARLAGDEGRARMALANPSFTLYLPAALLPPPRDDDDENDTETGNTTTLGNSENSPETGAETLVMLSQNGVKSVAPAMTREEYHELVAVRQSAIGLLNRCVEYYRKNQIADDGTIPRYDKIAMNAAERGKIVDDLWDSSFVIKSQNKTVVDPQYYKTCEALMNAIISGRAKVYPFGYTERKQRRLDDAVMALPEMTR